MGFFKDFKDDFSQALGELLPGEDDYVEEVPVETTSVDVEDEFSKLDGLLEKVESKANAANVESEPVLEDIDEIWKPDLESVEETDMSAPSNIDSFDEEIKAESDDNITESQDEVFEEISLEPLELEQNEPESIELESNTIELTSNTIEPDFNMNLEAENESLGFDNNDNASYEEDKEMDMDTINAVAEVTEETVDTVEPEINLEVSDEVSVITEGTKIKGNMDTNGSIEIRGKVEGDIKCNGKLTVTGSVIGSSSSSEFFADASHIEGEVVSSGTVKIGIGSVIIGNITATSAVIAGAVKGDIDVHGPVVVDTSAVIMGNIKSRSVQINNGAVIEGFCSQCYSDIDVESLFGKVK